MFLDLKNLYLYYTYRRETHGRFNALIWSLNEIRLDHEYENSRL